MPKHAKPSQQTQWMVNATKTAQDVACFWGLTLDSAILSDWPTLNQLSQDSRTVAMNDVFVALQGHNTHGLEHLKSVLCKQPGLVITDRALSDEESEWLESIDFDLEVWVIERLAERLGEFADWFYGHPSQRIKVVGITGTNGKTSTAFYTAQLLHAQGETVALMGTLGNGLLGALTPSANTTPDAITVHRLLAEFIEQGAGWVIMEVSSHALVLHRVKAVQFATVALTQVTRDHLDFHQTQAAYHSAKKLLFTDYVTQHYVVNADDPLGQGLLATALATPLEPPKTRLAYSALPGERASAAAELRCTHCVLSVQGLHVTLQWRTQPPATVLIPLLGAFNLENVLCALAILLTNGFAWSSLITALPHLTPVAGRMQRVAQQPLVLVDFAHTPDALQQLLKSVKGHLAVPEKAAQFFERASGESPKLWLVFGCGGDRDAGKRPLMAKIAEEMADRVILTNDNPRFESPETIVAQIRQGFIYLERVVIELNRQRAIEQALQLAKPNDMVVIAGKGHEAYQDIKGVKIPFSDAQVALDFLARRA